MNGLIKIIKEDIVGTENRWIAFAWLGAVAGILALGVYLSSETMSFLGIADSRELQVNFEYPVSVKRVLVLPGQRVEKGDLLIELDQSELDQQIRVIRGQVNRLEAELQVRHDLNQIVGNSASGMNGDPVAVDLADYKNQLDYLETQKKNLYIFADVTGLVGAVNYKKGEKVPAFTALITLTPENPSYVQGFIHENMRTKLTLNAPVTVRGLNSGVQSVEGRIVSVGARMLPLPPRMLHNPAMQMWGREVIVELPERNGFLIGERVQIKPQVSWIGIPAAMANEKDAEKAAAKIDRSVHAMSFSKSLNDTYSIEPSGAVFLPDLKKFLVVSDDTDEAKTPVVFLMNPDGSLQDEPMTIPGLKKVSDLESVSSVGDAVYLLSSQSLNKKGKAKSERNLFIKVTRSGLTLKDTKTVELREQLIAALKGSKDPKVKDLLKSFDESKFEIEGHYIDKGDLYLGLKAPLAQETESIILKVANVDALFATGRVSDVSVARVLHLALNGKVHRLTDLALVDGHVYATTSCKGSDCGAAWRLSDSKNPDLLSFYDGLKPEGLAYDPMTKSLLVTFDGKNNQAKFSRTGLMPQIGKPTQAANESQTSTH